MMMSCCSLGYDFDISTTPIQVSSLLAEPDIYDCILEAQITDERVQRWKELVSQKQDTRFRVADDGSLRMNDRWVVPDTSGLRQGLLRCAHQQTQQLHVSPLFSHQSSSLPHAVSPKRIFKASIIDSHNFIPKLLPQVIKSMEFTEGNGGAGSIKQVNFAYGSNLKMLKYRIDELNEETYTYNYTVIEGDTLTDSLQKITHKIKLEETLDGGTLSTVTSTYHTKGEFSLKEDDIKTGKEKVLGVYKAVEAYLVQNPNAYA